MMLCPGLSLGQSARPSGGAGPTLNKWRPADLFHDVQRESRFLARFHLFQQISRCRFDP